MMLDMFPIHNKLFAATFVTKKALKIKCTLSNENENNRKQLPNNMNK